MRFYFLGGPTEYIKQVHESRAVIFRELVISELEHITQQRAMCSDLGLSTCLIRN